MLVLSRQRDETIMIGDDIEITVVDIRGDKVRLGITAPSKVAVHRKEVYEAIKRENEQASRVGNDLSMFGRAAGVKGSVPSLARTRTSQLTSAASPLVAGTPQPGPQGQSSVPPGSPAPAPIPITPRVVSPPSSIPPKRSQDAG